MLKLQVLSITNDYYYKLIDIDTKQVYTHILEFTSLKQPIKTGDVIIIHKELLNPQYPGYNSSYTFGSINSIYGKDVNSSNDTDVIGLKRDNKKAIALKRLYG